ncbi:toxin [Candidatus Roizmanbacteria bacterium CG22_combo_CG10-13_8_21_14_all_35_9]|uniref:Toxin n=4 Tax=Patescibacteria group TaxID=1783273 RepID=A0A1J4TCJ5_9BACT|nr:MAG: toxin [Candidatus Falkowbacteria bacterium CG1_02_37_44]PIP14603.1 MAG: toxin [Candidatus Roizmanbacteria bacterium CG23_combo_of_CG06-09_8_20_14_all_35_49]PIP62774.1 MAG: toxin [Candidatus Roizmanbacteria bacterium CG22_combo_CG10-13_8_21_14_all_35_9]PIY71064.1 MAG: toxin [Candidatus Roizmanbacteria bacterium CG_4_10_14_0_8_um_filter_35_28]
MKYLDWNLKKNDWLKKNRNIGFEEVAIALIEGDLLDIIDNPSKNFPKQKVFVIKINKYIYYIPFVEDEEKFFLKTIIPSRKAIKKYLEKL